MTLPPFARLAGLFIALAMTACTTTYPPQVLKNTQLRTLPRSANGRDYLLYVALPPDYDSSPTKRYPVLYITDGYWDFTLINGFYGNLIYDQVAPQFIIVGFGYRGDHNTNADYDKLRHWDYMPYPDADGKDPERKTSGHADEFLAVVKNEFIPFIEKEYRVDPSYRVLSGNSQGGLLAIYSMLTQPGLFQAYIAASPYIHPALFDTEAKFAASGQKLNARFFLTGAEEENPKFLADIEKFNDTIAGRHYDGLTYQWRLIDGEKHTGTKAESYFRGLRFAFAPLAPPPPPPAPATPAAK